jgi:hypothetical protein
LLTQFFPTVEDPQGKNHDFNHPMSRSVHSVFEIIFTSFSSLSARNQCCIRLESYNKVYIGHLFAIRMLPHQEN